MRARHRGKCEACHQMIFVDDEIERRRVEDAWPRPERTGPWVHADCADPEPDVDEDGEPYRREIYD